MGADLLFFTAVSSLLLHEMDAIDKKEWRLLFVLRRLPDDGALRWFIVLHLPLFVALMALIAASESATVRWIEGGVDAFLIVHAGLHEQLGSRGEIAFANAFSRSLIWLAAGLGALHLVYLVMSAQ
jgi:hypothetical protein